MALAVPAMLAGAARADMAGPAELVVRGPAGRVLASLPLPEGRFAVSYRNSIYGTLAEERYAVLPGHRYRLTQLAADQLAVLEEYYAVPGAPRPAAQGDRRQWIAAPDPARKVEFSRLSIAATDLGQRTVHAPGQPPLALWRLVGDGAPFVTLELEGLPR